MPSIRLNRIRFRKERASRLKRSQYRTLMSDQKIGKELEKAWDHLHDQKKVQAPLYGRKGVLKSVTKTLMRNGAKLRYKAIIQKGLLSL